MKLGAVMKNKLAKNKPKIAFVRVYTSSTLDPVPHTTQIRYGAQKEGTFP